MRFGSFFRFCFVMLLVCAIHVCDAGFAFGQDCNNNGIPDFQDIDPSDPDGDGEVFGDCNGNLRPDSCDTSDFGIPTRYFPSGVRIDDRFGNSIAVDESYVVVGASARDENGSDSGAVYVFERIEGGLIEQEKLVGSESLSGDRFGTSVAISGNTIVVGANEENGVATLSGVAYIFRKVNNQWQEVSKLQASDGAIQDKFGQSVAIEGSVVMVGASGDDNSEGAIYVFGEIAGVWHEVQKITPGDVAAGKFFGSSIALQNDRLIVGAYGDNALGTRSGAAYVFNYIGGTWQQSAKLTAANTNGTDMFGFDVALDGDTALIGATNEGKAYVFQYSGSNWAEEAVLDSEIGSLNDNFGDSVAIENNVAVVGAFQSDQGFSNAGTAHVFRKIGGLWQEFDSLVASHPGLDNNFGIEVEVINEVAFIGAYRDDGGANNGGALYFYPLEKDCNNNQIPDECEIVGNDCDGNFVLDECQDDCDADGTPDTCEVAEFDCNSDGIPDDCQLEDNDCNANGVPDDCDWVAEFDQFDAGELIGSSGLGDSVKIDSNLAIAGAWAGLPGGAAYLFEVVNGEWQQVAVLSASDASPNDRFGLGVFLSDGVAIVGATRDDDAGNNSGSAYIFRSIEGLWQQTAKLTASDAEAGDNFGSGVCIVGDAAYIGANEDDVANINCGSAYVFRRIGEVWQQESHLIPSIHANGDDFGIAIDGTKDMVAVGAPNHDIAGSNSGAVFIFEFIGGEWQQTDILTANDATGGEQFGNSLSYSDGKLLVGANWDDENGSFSGSAYLFSRQMGTWQQTAKILASDGMASDDFGRSVSIYKNTLVIGASADDNQEINSGSAYVFREINGQWQQQFKIVSEMGFAQEHFGNSVGIGSEWLIVGSDKPINLSIRGAVTFYSVLPDCNGNGILDGCDSRGDLNGDGAVTVDDIEGFVSLLLVENQCDIADLNQDQAINGLDIEAFISNL